jgi:hypothetical protein
MLDSDKSLGEHNSRISSSIIRRLVILRAPPLICCQMKNIMFCVILDEPLYGNIETAISFNLPPELSDKGARKRMQILYAMSGRQQREKCRIQFPSPPYFIASCY